MTSQNLKKKIIEIGKFLFDKGYIVATDGNISSRLNFKEILITRTGVCKEELKIGDIIKLNITRNVIQSVSKESQGSQNSEIASTTTLSRNDKIAPSTEYRMHLEIYKNRPDINAIIHAHPPFATTFAVTGKRLNVKLLTETEATLGQIGYIGYLKPGSLELAKEVGQTSIKHNIMMLAHHGVVVIGKDLTNARYRLERLEFLAKVTLFTFLFT